MEDPFCSAISTTTTPAPDDRRGQHAPRTTPQPAKSAAFLSLTPEAGPDARYQCIVIRAGYVDAADGGKTNWLIPADVLARDYPLFEGVASYLDHPRVVGLGWRGEPQVRDLIGVVENVHYDPVDQLIFGELRLYDDHPHSPGSQVKALLDQMLADKTAGRAVPAIGLSAVFYHEPELDDETGTKITRRFTMVESIDLVYSPGAGGYVLEALSRARAVPRSVIASEAKQSPNPERNPTMPEEPVDYVTLAPSAQGQGAADGNAPPTAPLCPPDRQFDAQPTSTGRAASISQADVMAAIRGISQRVEQLYSRMDALTQDLEGAPAVSADASANTLEDLHAQIQHLSHLVAGREEGRTVQGMGRAPRDTGNLLPARLTVVDPLPEFQNAWDWVFGADGARLPPPELRRTDFLYRMLSGDLSWSGVFDPREALTAATTTTLADMAVNAMNKVIVPLYNRLDHYRWYEKIVAVQPTDGTLHDMAWLQFGGIANLPVVAEGAAYTELSVADTKETAAFTKYGGYVGITDKVLRNSEIARLQAIPRALTIAAIQTRSAKIAALFTTASGTGPTLAQDSVVLFHTASHGNLATTAFSWSAWQAARIECAKQTELGSSLRQALFPKFCLVPVDLYDTALQIFGFGSGAGGQPGTANNDVNPYAADRPGDPRPVPIMVPEWTDANDWAYIADPMVAPIIQMAYAENPNGRNHPPPELYTVTSKLAGLMFTNDVLPIKIRDYFAYGVATYRGIGKRNVA